MVAQVVLAMDLMRQVLQAVLEVQETLAQVLVVMDKLLLQMVLTVVYTQLVAVAVKRQLVKADQEAQVLKDT